MIPAGEGYDRVVGIFYDRSEKRLRLLGPARRSVTSCLIAMKLAISPSELCTGAIRISSL